MGESLTQRRRVREEGLRIVNLCLEIKEKEMNSNWFKLIMKLTKVEYGKNLLLKGMPLIYNKGGAKLKIGKNVTVKSSFLSNLVGLYSRTIIVTRASGAVIEIGNNVGISGATIYARKGIYIGDNTCIGGNCKILDNDFHPVDVEARNKLLSDVNGSRPSWATTSSPSTTGTA